MAVLEVMTRNLYAPQLSELVVQYHNDDEIDFYEVTPREDLIEFQKKLHYYSSWTLPRLRRMSTMNIIPIRFPGCASLESLSVDMDYCRNRERNQRRAFDAVALAAFLSSCPVLRRFSLRLTSVTFVSNGQLSDQVSMANVEELDLYLDGCHASCIKLFMDAVRFPHVSSIHFTIVGHESMNDIARHPSSNIQAVFSSPGVFPRLERLQFGARGNSYGRGRTLSVRLPIHNMPRLNCLRLHLTGTIIEPLVDDQAIPAHLSSVFLDDCWTSGRKWVIQLVRGLQMRGRLDSLDVSTRVVSGGQWARGDYMLSRKRLSELAELALVPGGA